MADLIDRELIAPLFAIFKEKDTLGFTPLEILNAAPSVDAVEVVRCRDCGGSRPLNRADRLENTFYDGCVWCMIHGDGVSGDFFCGDGKRREE